MLTLVLIFVYVFFIYFHVAEIRFAAESSTLVHRLSSVLLLQTWVKPADN